MTAEVAVLNKSAVALAADSAVTLSGSEDGGGVAKIFQNENKLFELSRQHPVAAMLYNATNFFDIPWEVILKSFRVDVGDTARDHLFDWWDCLNSYLQAHEAFLPNEARQRDFLKQILVFEFQQVLSTFFDKTNSLEFQRTGRDANSRFTTAFDDVTSSRKRSFDRYPFYDGFTQDLCREMLHVHNEEWTEAYDAVFSDAPLTDENKNGLRELAIALIGRSRVSWFTTGLVLAGFGDKEIFPSLRSVEIGGIIGGRIRWRNVQRVDIDRSAATAAIIPFAQRETVDTLLYGRSTRYQNQLVEHFSEAMRQIGFNIISELTRPGAKRAD